MDTYNKSESIWNKNFTFLFISRLVKLSGDGFAFNSILWFLIFDGEGAIGTALLIAVTFLPEAMLAPITGPFMKLTYAEILDVFFRPHARGGRVNHSGLLF